MKTKNTSAKSAARNSDKKITELCYTAKDLPFVLLPVKSVTARKGFGTGMDWYKIDFGGAFLAATRYHAFLVLRNSKEVYLPTQKLRRGDQIWVDISAFLSDGSLHVVRRDK